MYLDPTWEYGYLLLNTWPKRQEYKVSCCICQSQRQYKYIYIYIYIYIIWIFFWKVLWPWKIWWCSRHIFKTFRLGKFYVDLRLTWPVTVIEIYLTDTRCPAQTSFFIPAPTLLKCISLNTSFTVKLHYPCRQAIVAIITSYLCGKNVF